MYNALHCNNVTRVRVSCYFHTSCQRVREAGKVSRFDHVETRGRVHRAYLFPFPATQRLDAAAR